MSISLANSNPQNNSHRPRKRLFPLLFSRTFGDQKPSVPRKKQSKSRVQLESDHSRQIGLSSLIALGILGVGYAAFINSGVYYISIMVIFFPTLCFCFFRWLRQQDEVRARQEFILLLDDWNARLLSGSPMELTLRQSAQRLSTTLSPQGKLYPSLLKLSQNLSSGLGVPQSLQLFSQQFDFEFSRPLLSLLPETSFRGDVLIRFLKALRQSLRKEQEMENDLQNESASTRAECLAMTGMPFIMNFLNRARSTTGTQSSSLSPFVHCLLAFFSMMALSLALLILSHSGSAAPLPKFPDLKAKKRSLGKQRHPTQHSSRPHLSAFVPPGIQVKTQLALRHLYPAVPDRTQFWSRFCEEKVLWGSGLILLMAFLIPFPPLLLLIPLIPTVLSLQLIQKDQQWSDVEQSTLPQWISLLTALLGCGLTLERALQFSLKAFSKGRGQRTPLQLILKRVSKNRLMGGSASALFHRLAQEQTQTDLSQIFAQMARIQQEGSLESIEILRLQNDQTQQVRRSALRRQGARRTLGLFLPMSLDLVLVILICVLPAILSFISFE